MVADKAPADTGGSSPANWARRPHLLRRRPGAGEAEAVSGCPAGAAGVAAGGLAEREGQRNAWRQHDLLAGRNRGTPAGAFT